MHGLVALDAAGAVIRPAILWNDGRTAAECAEIEERIGLDELIARTGNRALPGFTAPKLLWLRRHEPDAYRRIARIALPKDYVRLRLCGEHAIDVADASGTLLLDVARRRWSEHVLEALELDPAWLPPVLESPAVSGVTADGVPVAAGAGDQAAGALGVGVDRPGPLSIALGTSGVVFAALPGFAADERARVHAFCHAVPGGWHAMGVMLSAAGSLRWLRDVAAPGHRLRRAGRRGGALGGRRRGADVPALPRRRAHAARRSRCARLVHRPLAAPRPRRARARGAGGRRVRPARLARPAARARRGARARARLGRRRALGALAADHRVGARAAARAPGRRGGGGLRRRTARRRGRRRLAGRRGGRRGLRAGARRGRAGPPGPAYAEGRERFRALYPALRPLQ